MQRCFGCMKEFGSEYEICPHCGYMTDENPTDKNHLIPGTVLVNRYMLGCAIGHGGFGITYIAWDEKIQKKVAVKEYFPNAFSTRQVGVTEVSFYNEKAEKYFKDGLSKMLDEARRISRFSDNENIVDIYDYFEENNTAYIVMEYLEGKDLKKYLDENGGKVIPERAVEIILPVLNALKDMHKENLIHRDISPDNIYMCNNGKVKLLDFGAARLAVEDSEKSLSVMVKRGYAPREQYISSSKQGPWTDVYAVCATIYRMITGEVPSESVERDEEPLKNFAEFDIFNYDQLEKVLFKGLEPSITDRIQSVKTLEKMLLGENVTEEKTYIPQKTVRIPTQKPSKETKSKKSKKIFAIILACVIALGGGAAIFATVSNKGDSSKLDAAANLYAAKLAEYDIVSAYVEDINNDGTPEVFFRDYELGEQKVMTYSSKVGLCIQDLTTVSEDLGEMYFAAGEESGSVGIYEMVQLYCEDYGADRPTLYEMDRYGFEGGYTLFGVFSDYDEYKCYSDYAVTENVVEYLSDALDVNFKNKIKDYENQKERLYNLVDEKYEDEIVEFTCSDFDYDGTYEAFAVIDVNETELIGVDGIVCFINCDGDIKEIFEGNCAALDDRVGEQYSRYYQFGDLNDDNYLSRTWYVDGKYVAEISELNYAGCQSFYVEECHPYFRDTLVSTVIDDDGISGKDYYYYETDDGIKEYGGVLITESDLQEMAYTEGEYTAIRSVIDEYQMEVGEIFYRENGIININLSREENGIICYYYLTVFRVDGHLWMNETDILSCNGNYDKANTPNIAEYFIY